VSLLDPAMVIRFTGPSSASPRFVRAPVLRWHPVAVATRFAVAVADVDEVVWTATVTAPEVDLAPAWPDLKLGPVDVLVRGFDDDGVEVSVRAHRRFWRVPGFDGLRPVPADWGTAAREAVAYLLDPARDPLADYERDEPRNAWRSFEDSVTGLRGRVGFPALHHPSHILALMAFADANPTDPLAGQARRQALAYGAWLLDHGLPAGWRCAGLAPSTVEDGAVGGWVEGGAITLFRAARVGEALLRLHAHTGDDAYLARARRIADVLLDLQEPDGSLPFRVNPRDGAVVERYTSAVVTPMRLFAMLEDDHEPYREARLRAEAWLVAGPLTDGRWEGMYEDIPGTEPWTNLENWDVLETIRYLLGPHCTLPDRVAHAEALNAFVEDQFVVWAPEQSPVTVRCPTPAVLEQFRCYHPMEVHTGNWLVSLLALHRATGADHYLAKGIAAANTIAASQHELGALSTWGLDTRFGTPLITLDWPGCNAVAVSALLHWQAYRAEPKGYDPGPWAV
jgi:hypothetical protein